MSIRSLVLFFLVALIGLSSTACMNMSTLQTARALEVGEQRLIVGGGMSGASESIELDEDETSVSAALPYFELGFRMGVVENLEAGVKWTMPGGLGIDGKYQLMGSEGLAVAVGLGAAYLSLESSSGDSSASNSRVDIQVPVYVSYDLAQFFSVYAAPKYLASINRTSATSSGTTESNTSLWHLAGGTGGVKIGNKVGLFLEGSYMFGLNEESPDLVQGNGSLFVSF